MVARKKRKVKRRGRKSKVDKVRSAAAIRGWEKRRKKELGDVPAKRELERLRRELAKAKKRAKKAEERAEEAEGRLELAQADRDEREAIIEESQEVMTGFFDLPPLFQQLVSGHAELSGGVNRSKEEAIRETLDFFWKIYGNGPGLLDTAQGLAEYYEMSLDEVFDLWETPD